MKKRMQRLISALLLSALVLTGCNGNGAAPATETTAAAETTAAPAKSQAENSYQAGTYEAAVTGHNGEITVQVEFSESEILTITVTDHSETAGLGDTAMDDIIAVVLSKQTLGVDAVSGATVSSDAIIAAITDCAEQAGGNVDYLLSIAVEAEEVVLSGQEMTLSADYVVIGAGPAGLASAIEAAEAGLSVIVFEKTGRTGGAASMGMGPLALETELQAMQNETIYIDEAYNMFMEYTHYRVDGELVRRYFDLSADTVTWLEAMGVEFEEAARYFDKSYPSWHIVKSDDGTVGGGQGATMTRRMTEQAEALGVEIYLHTPVEQILMDGGKAVGVKAVNTENGDSYQVSADAVLVATGGFGNNLEMITEELGYVWGEDYFGMALNGHEGDGILMALDAGAAKGNTNIEMIFNIYANGGPAITNDITILMRQPGLLVNQEGRRFFNEEEVQNTTYMGNSLVRQSGNTGYMIMTESILADYISNGVDFESRVYHWEDLSTFYDTVEALMAGGSPSVYKADTLEDLADFFGIDADSLSATVDAYNSYCQDGSDPLGKSAEYLRAINDGPYYAAQYFPGSYGTLGGISINTDLEVVNSNNQPIPGLYSAGTDSCEIFGDSYMFLLPGNTMGYCLNSGRLAAAVLSII